MSEAERSSHELGVCRPPIPGPHMTERQRNELHWAEKGKSVPVRRGWRGMKKTRMDVHFGTCSHGGEKILSYFFKKIKIKNRKQSAISRNAFIHTETQKTPAS